MTTTHIEIRVRTLLQRAKIEGPPVDVELIAGILNAEVRREPTEGDVSGALLRRGATSVIGVNANHASSRQRFTIAHEIGHLLLHDEFGKTLHMDRGMTMTVMSNAPVSRRFLRDKVSSLATNPKEIEANQFAATLLMPKAFLARALKEYSIPLHEKDLNALADAFKVSAQAMGFRLTNLGVPLVL